MVRGISNLDKAMRLNEGCFASRMSSTSTPLGLSRPLTLLLSNLLIPIAISIFALGFFPYKPFLPGLASFNHGPAAHDVPKAQFNKVVFMVVDALRRLAAPYASKALLG